MTRCGSCLTKKWLLDLGLTEKEQVSAIGFLKQVDRQKPFFVRYGTGRWSKADESSLRYVEEIPCERTTTPREPQPP